MALSSLHFHPLPLAYTVITQRHTTPFSFSLSSTFRFSSSSALSSSTSATHHPLPPDFSPSQLLDLLRRQPDESSALRLFQWASAQPNYSAHPSVFHELLRQLARAGSFDSMLTLLRQMHSSKIPVDESTFLIFLETYANSELHSEINPLIHLMERDFAVKPDTRFYNVALSLLVKANKLKLVETLHSKMVADAIQHSNQGFVQGPSITARDSYA